jgi:hypothetical protein
MANQTMALAKARLARVRTRSQPFTAYLPHRLLTYQPPVAKATTATNARTVAVA